MTYVRYAVFNKVRTDMIWILTNMHPTQPTKNQELHMSHAAQRHLKNFTLALMFGSDPTSRGAGGAGRGGKEEGFQSSDSPVGGCAMLWGGGRWRGSQHSQGLKAHGLRPGPLSTVTESSHLVNEGHAELFNLKLNGEYS